jgi:hypothetical protein
MVDSQQTCIYICKKADHKTDSRLFTDDSGKLFINVRLWSKQNSSVPSYDEAEPFLVFIDKYVKLAIGGHFFSKWMKMNRKKTLLDKVTPSDIAYTILVCENSKVRIYNSKMIFKL